MDKLLKRISKLEEAAMNPEKQYCPVVLTYSEADGYFAKHPELSRDGLGVILVTDAETKFITEKILSGWLPGDPVPLEGPEGSGPGTTGRGKN